MCDRVSVRERNYMLQGNSYMYCFTLMVALHDLLSTSHNLKKHQASSFDLTTELIPKCSVIQINLIQSKQSLYRQRLTLILISGWDISGTSYISISSALIAFIDSSSCRTWILLQSAILPVVLHLLSSLPTLLPLSSDC